jgi:hypothetical protein
LNRQKPKQTNTKGVLAEGATMEDSFRFIIARLAQCADSKNDPIPIHSFADLHLQYLEGQPKPTETAGQESNPRTPDS